ncbi:MAG: orotate phosphoribosyltransferase [Bacteroidales bacterium]
METTEIIVAKQLLDVKAVLLNPEKPFRWVSGWLSPIYCDNRKILSYPTSRNIILDQLIAVIERDYPKVEVIAGVATGAIAWGALVADRLNKPFVYVRPKPKSHGTGVRVEGELVPQSKVVVVEDLISTGRSSISAADSITEKGGEVLGMIAIFSYGFNKSRKAFEDANLELRTLTNYDTLIKEAVNRKYIRPEAIDTLIDWRFQPEVWGEQHSSTK